MQRRRRQPHPHPNEKQKEREKEGGRAGEVLKRGYNCCRRPPAPASVPPHSYFSLSRSRGHSPVARARPMHNLSFGGDPCGCSPPRLCRNPGFFVRHSSKGVLSSPPPCFLYLVGRCAVQQFDLMWKSRKIRILEEMTRAAACLSFKRLPPGGDSGRQDEKCRGHLTRPPSVCFSSE